MSTMFNFSRELTSPIRSANTSIDITNIMDGNRDISEDLMKLETLVLDDKSMTEILKEKIRRFPNVMEEVLSYTKNIPQFLLEKIENSLNNDKLYDFEDEIRHKIVQVFLLWNLKELTRAEDLANEVLEKVADNLVALTNLAYINLYYENYSEVKKLVGHLESLEKRQDFPMIEAEGKMYVAFCLSKLSFAGHRRSIELYKEALKVLPNNYSLLFSISLMLYRIERDTVDKKEKGIILDEIVKYSEKIRCDFHRHQQKHLMGRSLLLLGLIKFHPANKHSKCNEEYFQRALHFCPDDRYILEKCGKYYLYVSNVEKCEELFKKAIKINETSLSHHHLALNYLKKNDRTFSYNRWNSSYSKTRNIKGKLLKYPLDVPCLQRSEFTNKAEHHFKESLRLCPENDSSRYDLMLFYFSLKEYKKSKECCDKITTTFKERQVCVNLMCGRLCHILAEQEMDKEEIQSLKDDAVDKFFLAVTDAIDLIPIDKELKDIWKIKEIMLYIYSFGNISYNDQLLKFYEFTSELSEDKLFMKLLKENDGSELSQIIRILCKKEQYFQAYFFLRCPEVKPNEIDPKLEKEIYIKLAQSLPKTKMKCRQKLFRKCYDVCFNFDSQNQREKTDSYFKYDINILTSEITKDFAEKIKKSLEIYFGLKATFGEEDYILGNLKSENLCSKMKASCNIGILLDNSNNLSQLLHAKQIMKDRQVKIGQLFIINHYKKTHIPSQHEDLPQITCLSEHMEHVFNIFKFLCELS